MRLAIPALLLAALTLQATPVPFLEGAEINFISNSIDATGAATTGIGGNVDLTPGRFLHIPGYSSLSFTLGDPLLVIVNSAQSAPYIVAFDWAWDGPAMGVQPFMLSYTVPAEGAPEPGAFWLALGGVIVIVGQWAILAIRRKRSRKSEAADIARFAQQRRTLASMQEFHQHLGSGK